MHMLWKRPQSGERYLAYGQVARLPEHMHPVQAILLSAELVAVLFD